MTLLSQNGILQYASINERIQLFDETSFLSHMAQFNCREPASNALHETIACLTQQFKLKDRDRLFFLYILKPQNTLIITVGIIKDLMFENEQLEKSEVLGHVTCTVNDAGFITDIHATEGDITNQPASIAMEKITTLSRHTFATVAHTCFALTKQHLDKQNKILYGLFYRVQDKMERAKIKALLCCNDTALEPTADIAALAMSRNHVVITDVNECGSGHFTVGFHSPGRQVGSTLISHLSKSYSCDHLITAATDMVQFLDQGILPLETLHFPSDEGDAITRPFLTWS